MIATLSSAPTLKAAYIGKAGDFEPTADHIRALKHIADHGAPIPSIEAIWLIDQLKAVTTERDALRELVSQCADSIARASENIDAVMAATDYTERTMGL